MVIKISSELEELRRKEGLDQQIGWYLSLLGFKGSYELKHNPLCITLIYGHEAITTLLELQPCDELTRKLGFLSPHGDPYTYAVFKIQYRRLKEILEKKAG